MRRGIRFALGGAAIALCLTLVALGLLAWGVLSMLAIGVREHRD